MNNTVVIIVKGGLVQSVYSRSENINIEVLDYDNVSASPDDDEIFDYAEKIENMIKNMKCVY